MHVSPPAACHTFCSYIQSSTALQATDVSSTPAWSPQVSLWTSVSVSLSHLSPLHAAMTKLSHVRFLFPLDLSDPGIKPEPPSTCTLHCTDERTSVQAFLSPRRLPLWSQLCLRLSSFLSSFSFLPPPSIYLCVFWRYITLVSSLQLVNLLVSIWSICSGR